jgi:hypothetical protein
MNTTSIKTPSEVNKANARFWQERRKMIKNAAMFAIVLETWQARLPTGSWDAATDDVFRIGRAVLKDQSRRGGAAPKTDALQHRIEEFVTHRLDISRDELLRLLRREIGMGLITDIYDETIEFAIGRDRTKVAQLTGLKDRLSRAKKAVRGRLD